MPFGSSLMMHAVAQSAKRDGPPSMAAFLEWARKNPTFGPIVCHWLVALIGDEGWHGLRLALKRKRGGSGLPSRKIKKHVEARDYYEALLQRGVDGKLCEAYAKAIRAQPLQIERGMKPATLADHSYRPAVYVIRKGTKVTRLKKRRPVPKYMALALTRAKFNIPEDTLRKAFRRLPA